MAASIFDAAAAPAADLPKRGKFMRSQNGPAKAKLLNMHTKALIRPFDKSASQKPSMPVCALQAGPVHKSVAGPPFRKWQPITAFDACSTTLRAAAIGTQSHGVLIMFGREIKNDRPIRPRCAEIGGRHLARIRLGGVAASSRSDLRRPRKSATLLA